MSRLSYVIKCIKEIDLKNMFKFLQKIHRKSKKSYIYIICDIIWCGFKYGTGYMDYERSEWWNLNKSQRATFITRGINNTLVSKLNNPVYFDLLHNKVKFNKLFSKYIERKWIYLSENSLEKFEKFMKDLDIVIAKPITGSCGSSINKFCKKDFSSIHSMYKSILSTGSFLVEEYITQHETIAKICSASVNTIRIVTLISDDLESHVIYAFMRFGKDKVVDNFHAGGIAAPIDLATGLVKTAFDREGNYYEKHQLTGATILGLKVPMFEQAKALVIEATKLIPQIRYIGWDVAITPEKPILIEGNQYPGGYDFFQRPLYAPNKIGMLPYYKQFINI